MKRILACLIVACVAACLFAGCSSSDDEAAAPAVEFPLTMQVGERVLDLREITANGLQEAGFIDSNASSGLFGWVADLSRGVVQPGETRSMTFLYEDSLELRADLVNRTDEPVSVADAHVARISVRSLSDSVMDVTVAGVSMAKDKPNDLKGRYGAMLVREPYLMIWRMDDGSMLTVMIDESTNMIASVNVSFR